MQIKSVYLQMLTLNRLKVTTDRVRRRDLQTLLRFFHGDRGRNNKGDFCLICLSNLEFHWLIH